MQNILNSCILPVENGKDGRMPVTVLVRVCLAASSISPFVLTQQFPQIKKQAKFLFHPADVIADVKKAISAWYA